MVLRREKVPRSRDPKKLATPPNSQKKYSIRMHLGPDTPTLKLVQNAFYTKIIFQFLKILFFWGGERLAPWSGRLWPLSSVGC